MAVLTVRRPSPSESRQGRSVLVFQGKHLPVGAQIDTADFPRVGKIKGKWAQLIRLGYFHDDHLTDPDLVREVAAQRDEYGSAPAVDSRPDPVVPIDRDALGNPVLSAEDHARLDKPIGLQCGECGFQATSAKGLKTHTTRKHTKE
jgi:hypothetical protein